MTEQEWLAATNPTPMLEFLKGTTSERKLRLFACACCRRIWPALKRSGSRKVVEVCELYADGLTTTKKLDTAHVSAHDAFARIQWTADGDEETTPARATIYLGGGTDFYPHVSLVKLRRRSGSKRENGITIAADKPPTPRGWKNRLGTSTTLSTSRQRPKRSEHKPTCYAASSATPSAL